MRRLASRSVIVTTSGSLARQLFPNLHVVDGLDKDGVFVFRTLEDTRALLERSGQGVKAVRAA